MAQTRPANWASLFGSAHKTEWRFDVNGVTYRGSDIVGTPVITKPLLDVPAIGRTCIGSLSLRVYPKDTIPKGAAVNAFCRLTSSDGQTSTNWVPQGQYSISSRSGKNPLSLVCFDKMMVANQTYRDKTTLTEWPQPMSVVVADIANTMDVTVDSRTTILSGADYVVSYPDEDVLISEILGMIGVAHGGSWVMTESGALRLILLASPASTEVQDVGKAHSGFTLTGTNRSITRVTLIDDANNEFTAGNDTGASISAKCGYATQGIANALCTQNSGSLYGVTYIPYNLDSAYLDPCLELGDTIRVTDRNGTQQRVAIFSLKIKCTVAGTANAAAGVQEETEDEYPYKSARDLMIERTVRTNQTYYGNRINRTDGFVSELLVNGEAKARMTANASVFTMQAYENGGWHDRIFFDPITGKYVIAGGVTFKALEEEQGETFIHGGNIMTGTVKAETIATGVLQSVDGRLKFDLTQGKFTVGSNDLETAIAKIDNAVTITASSQIFAKAADAETYSPATITLTAVTSGGISTWKWYKDNAIISGATSSTLTVRPTDISDNAATYKVVCTDTNGNSYTDYITIAKVSDGYTPQKGIDYFDGTDGTDGVSIVFKGDFPSAPSNPQDGWAYYNTTAKASYTYRGGTWYQMSVDGVNGQNGTSIVWKGTSSAPPTNPQTDWAYRDSDDGKVYIYNGTGWEVMVLDGSDGKDGAAGSDGESVYITYHDNPPTSTPATPTGSGTSGGWHTDATSAAVWISQKVAASASAGTWGTPIRIKGSDGAKGDGGLTVLLDNEYIEVPVGINNKPTQASTYPCNITVYKGASPLTYVRSNPSAEQYTIGTVTTPTGITVTKSTTLPQLSIKTSTASAIDDIGKITVPIITGDGLTISAHITVCANMNAVVVTYDADIKTLENNISLKVSETTYHTDVPVYQATDPSSGWTSAQKTANIGFLWYDTTHSQMKRWSGSAWVAITEQNAGNWASYTAAQIKLLHNDIDLRVEKNGVINAINLSSEGAKIDAGRLDLYGKMAVYSGREGQTGTELAGYVGYAQSNVSTDWGIMLQSDTPNTGEVIATDQGARISYAGTTSQVYASQTQAGMIAPGCVIECSSANTGKVIAGYSGGSLSYGNTDLTYDGYSQLTSSQKAERDANMQKVARVYAAEGISGMKSKSVEIASLYEGGVVKLKHAHTTATSPDPDGWSAYWCGGGSGAIFAPDTAYASLGVSSDGSSVDGITLYRWQNGYFKNVYNSAGAITSSDRRLKYDISYDLSRYIGLLDELKPATFKYIDGESERTHTGLIADDLRAGMAKLGLDTIDFAGYVYNPDSGTCGIRYDEITPLLILGYQMLKNKLTDMEALLNER